MKDLRGFLPEHLRGLPFDASNPFIEDLLRPKLTESLYRQHMTLGRYALSAVSMLATYAACTRHSS